MNGVIYLSIAVIGIGVAIALWVVFLILAVKQFKAFHALIAYLKEHHHDVWVGLKEPKLFGVGIVYSKAQFALFRYLKKREYKELHDEELDTLATRATMMVKRSAKVFVSITVILILVTCAIARADLAFIPPIGYEGVSHKGTYADVCTHSMTGEKIEHCSDRFPVSYDQLQRPGTGFVSDMIIVESLTRAQCGEFGGYVIRDEVGQCGEDEDLLGFVVEDDTQAYCCSLK